MEKVNGSADAAGSVPPVLESESAAQKKTLPHNLLEQLKAPLPPQAVAPNPDKPGLSSIKVIYVVERLNEVFGLNGWHMTNEVVEKGAMVVVKGTLIIEDYGIRIEQYGGNANPDRGDAYKGACTDALSKCASYIGIGMDVYKGLHEDRPSKGENQKATRVSPTNPNKAIVTLTARNVTERFSTIREILGEEEYGAIIGRFGCVEGSSDLEHARQAYAALLEAFRARYRETREALGAAEYRRILEDLRFRPTARLRPDQAAKVFRCMTERLYAAR